MESEKRLNPLRALKERDFLLLWIGQALSSLGSAFQAVALTWMMLSLRGSAIDVSLALLFLTIPQAVLTLAGGLLTDRLDARSVMILADTLRLFTAGALALLVGSVATHLWLIWGVLALHGIGNALFVPAAASMAPRLVQTDDLESANALVSAMVQIGPLVGYLSAGLLLGTFGPGPAFACNAVSYAVAVALALLMRPLERSQRGERRLMSYDIRETATYLRTVPWLLVMFFMDCMVAFAGISTNSIGAPLLSRNVLHAGVQGYSFLAWSYSAGAITGLLLPALRPVRSNRGRFCIVCHGAEAVLLTLIAFAPLPIGAFCMFFWSLLNGALVVVMVSLIQEQTPGHLLGRVMAFFMLASTGMLPIAQGTSGFIANIIGAQGLFVLAGALVLASGVLGGSVPALRQLH